MTRFEAVAVHVASPSGWAVAVSVVYWRVIYFEMKNAVEAAGLAASAAGSGLAVVVVAVVTYALLPE